MSDYSLIISCSLILSIIFMIIYFFTKKGPDNHTIIKERLCTSSFEHDIMTKIGLKRSEVA